MRDNAGDKMTNYEFATFLRLTAVYKKTIYKNKNNIV
jgi:hypothetical protein